MSEPSVAGERWVVKGHESMLAESYHYGLHFKNEWCSFLYPCTPAPEAEAAAFRAKQVTITTEGE